MKIAKQPALEDLVQRRHVPQSDRTASALASAARARARQVIAYAQTVRFNSWDDLATRFNVAVMPNPEPMSYMAVLRWAKWYEQNAVTAALVNEARDSIDNADAARIKFPQLEEVVIGAYKLRPRQRKARWQILKQLVEDERSTAVLCPMNTGSGKTIVAASIIAAFQQNKYFGLGNGALPLWNIVYVVPKAVQIKTARTLAKAGIKGIGTDVHVIPYSGFHSKQYKHLFQAESVIDPFNGMPKDILKFKMGVPALVIFDESHKLKKADTGVSRYAAAFLHERTRFMFMSATPAVVLEDLRLFARAARVRWNNERLDDTNWAAFTSVVGKCGRRELNAAALERVFKWFDSAIVNPPADPRKVKAYNGVKLIQFESERSRERYHNAQDAWLDMCKRFGKEPGRAGEVLVAFTNFRRAAEYEAVPQVVRLSLAEHANGRAPINAVCFKETVKMLVADYAKAGIPRSKISIVWGGEQEINEKDVFTLFEWLKLRAEVEREGFEWQDKKLRAKYNKSEKYHQTRLKAERTVDEQRDLDAWTKNMRLQDQTAEMRQDEIDNFLEGRTEFCIFTLAAGGTGIDLDQQVEGVRPRSMFAMPCYYAEEFVQAFGRAYREFTLSDVYQYVILFDKTIVTNHVAPRLAKKLAAINKSAGAGLNLEADLTAAATNDRLKDIEEAKEVTVETADVIVADDDDDEEEE